MSIVHNRHSTTAASHRFHRDIGDDELDALGGEAAAIVGVIRAWVRETCRKHAVAEEDIDIVELIASELAGNVIKHADARGRMTLTITALKVIFGACDFHPERALGPIRRFDPDAEDFDAEGGRGLPLVWAATHYDEDEGASSRASAPRRLRVDLRIPGTKRVVAAVRRHVTDTVNGAAP